MREVTDGSPLLIEESAPFLNFDLDSITKVLIDSSVRDNYNHTSADNVLHTKSSRKSVLNSGVSVRFGEVARQWLTHWGSSVLAHMTLGS